MVQLIHAHNSGWKRMQDWLMADDVSERIENEHQVDNLLLFIYIFLLILTILLIWLFKYIKINYIHETGVAIIFGLLVGIGIRFMPSPSDQVVEVKPVNASLMPANNHIPEFLAMNIPKINNESHILFKRIGDIEKGKPSNMDKLEEAATFDPEVFFNIILPPIIFNAGYSMKRKHFFKNFGSILAFAFMGTVISTAVTGLICWGFLLLIQHGGFAFFTNFGLAECIFFGAIISATDPVTVLAIFSEMNVDVDLFALIFGESVMNDAVAIVLASTVETFIAQGTSSDASTGMAILSAVGSFLTIFCGSFAIGCVVGCVCAFLTKFTKIAEYPLLETSLVVLMSYSSFLAAEACKLTGIVSVLFCGICQAHYTYNNLSDDSQKRTKQFFELLNFCLENFIFSYIGVSVITMEGQHFHIGFFLAALLAIFVARAANVYPISFFLNLGRNHKIPANHQHMMMFSGLRGAIAFALAIRSATTPARNIILSTTSLIVIVTVIVCGGMTTPMLNILRIKNGDDETNNTNNANDDNSQESSIASSVKSSPNYNSIRDAENSAVKRSYKKSWFHKRFGNFDVRFLKPLLTHSKPSLEETCCLGCCSPLAACLTSDRQRNHAIQTLDEEDATTWELRRGETPLQDLQRRGGGGGGGGDGGEFPNIIVDRQMTDLVEDDEGLEAANIIIDKDNNVKY